MWGADWTYQVPVRSSPNTNQPSLTNATRQRSRDASAALAVIAQRSRDAPSSSASTSRVPEHKRKRASKPKVRTGCTTCKIRRIKCDETKPNCLRCTGTGRKCDGYEFQSSDDVQIPGRAAPTVPSRSSSSQIHLPSTLSLSVPGNSHERRIFQRFQVCTIPDLAGGSEGEFWNSLVLRLGQEQKVIRDVIIALGTLHEDYQKSGGKFSRDQINEPSHQNALRLYGHALREVNDQLNRGSRETAKIAIVASILFACFEVMRRKNMSAVIHYQAGMRELTRQITMSEELTSQADEPPRSSYTISPSTKPAPYLRKTPQSDWDQILVVFARYDIQACTFSKDVATPIKTEFIPVLPKHMSLSDVRWHLDNLIVSVYQIIKSSSGALRYSPMNTIQPDCKALRDEAVEIYQPWLIAIDNFFLQPDLKLSPKELKSTLGLRVQIRVSLIQLRTCMDFPTESGYDTFFQEFNEIISAIEMMSIQLGLKEGKPLEADQTPFTMDLGIIFPLFFIATKCRHWILRRRAIRELKKAGREGVWEGPIMALLAEKIVEIEEEGMAQPDDWPAEHMRIHRIENKIVDYHNRRVTAELTTPINVVSRDWQVRTVSIDF